MESPYRRLERELRTHPNSADGDFFTQQKAKRLRALHEHTGRNVVLYYSGYRDKVVLDESKTALSVDDELAMKNVCGELPKDSLDLIIQSPGGSIKPTEEIIQYLRDNFKSFHVYVPGSASSAATTLVCSADRIVMASHSFLGPTDVKFLVPTPDGQLSLPGNTILKRLRLMLNSGNRSERQLIWQEHGAYMINIEDTMNHARELSSRLLAENMFKDAENPEETGAEMAAWLSDQDVHKLHSRPLHRSILRKEGFKIDDMEDDKKTYDLVMAATHTARIEVMHTHATKIICSHTGVEEIVHEYPEEKSDGGNNENAK